MFIIKRLPEFDEWFEGLRDRMTGIRLGVRLDKAQRGILGDVRDPGVTSCNPRDPGVTSCNPTFDSKSTTPSPTCAIQIVKIRVESSTTIAHRQISLSRMQILHKQLLK